MPGTNLIEKIKNHFNGVTGHDFVKFTVNDTDFVFTDGAIYQSVDGSLCGGCKKAKTLKSVIKFVEARA